MHSVSILVNTSEVRKHCMSKLWTSELALPVPVCSCSHALSLKIVLICFSYYAAVSSSDSIQHWANECDYFNNKFPICITLLRKLAALRAQTPDGSIWLVSDFWANALTVFWLISWTFFLRATRISFPWKVLK